MNLKKYIVLSPVQETLRDDDNYPYTKCTVQTRLINGFTGDKTSHALNAKDEWTPLGNDKDRLYFLPGCNVPRFKVRDKFSVTIKPEYATACFVSQDTLVGSDTMFQQYKNLMPLSTKQAREFMDAVKDHKSRERFFMLFQNNDIETVFVTKEFWYNFCYSTSYFRVGQASDHFTTSRYQHKHVMAETQHQLYAVTPKSTIGLLKCDVYIEDSVLTHLNKDNLVLSEEKYEEFRNFGNAEDKENLILMMELMSNCDFEKSIVYLLFLLKEFGKPIQSTKESNHVNFKSLITFLKIKHDDLNSIDINAMTRILRANNQFTRTNAMRLSMLFAGDIINYSDAANACWNAGPVLKLDCETVLND